MSDDLGFVPEQSPQATTTPKPQDDGVGFQPDQARTQDDLGFQPDPTPNPHDNLTEQVKAGLEGAAQGVLGPLAPLAETHLFGVKPEDIKAREEAKPFTKKASEAAAFAVSMLMGTGEAALIAKAVPEVQALGKIGSMALKGALESMAMQGSDEASNIVTGNQDPQTPVASALAHIGAAGLFGAGGGTLFGTLNLGTNKGLQALEDAKLGNKAQSFLTGYGAAARGHSLEDAMPFLEAGYEGADKSMFRLGHKLYSSMPEQIGKQAADRSTELAGAAVGSKIGGPLGGIAGYKAAKVIEPVMEKLVGRPISAASRKFLMPIVTKVLTTGETKGLGTALDYATKATKGATAITKAMDSLFRIGGQQALDYEVNERQRNSIEKYIDDAGLQKEFQNTLQADPMPEQSFAEGGEVLQHPPINHFAKIFPDQNMLLSAAKGRVYTYLNGLKPRESMNKLPFDREPDNGLQKRAYDRALDIAANPLSIVKHIKTGNITPQHMQHFMGMWPELHDHLSKEITNRIVHGQVKDEKPNFKVRQALSLFLGSPLEATFTPTAIMAAQSAFQPMQPPQQAGKPKKDTGKIGSKSNDMYQTADQNAEKDQSTRD